ncbi:S49 family peptidase [Rhizobium wenxiniae]|uniref:S49 family peptidase n=1 Tax=Rhizobium wenxiniae TaxID=1737357 RepID=UPI003C187350
MNAILARFQDTTALVDESRSAWLEACAEMGAEKFAEIEKAAANDNGFWLHEDDWRSRFRPYVVKNGILYVPVKGLLVNDFPWTIGSWITGYEYIYQAVKRGRDDSDVKGIVLVIDSGGGMVSGNWDLVDFIFESRSVKPIRAVAAEHAYSAAYNIAAATSHITVARTGGVGSIGVIITHFERSEMLKQMGIKVNLIRSKPGKMQGNSLEPLSEDARKHFEEQVNELHAQFVAMVARGRGMSEEAVDATDAKTFMARQAVELGLADATGTIDDAVTAFEATFSQEGDEPMADINQADHEAAVNTARTEGHTAGAAEGSKKGAADMRARIEAIVSSDEGKKRPAMALKLATGEKFASLDAETAIGMLADMPEEKAASTEAKPNGAGAPAGMLKAAMDGIEQPNISADGSGDDKPTNQAEQDRALINAFGLAGFDGKKE